ncbi:condensin subunit Smc [Anaerovibrio lipolyticus DSM 3074]|uniref:Chromosome partition protein Smc n=1 Tax=Anaerovibrio lipolyticus DSM 3074 TaxID=1120997 RepID=A0A1M6DEP6_9FIRM|nr:chromosome segregation protein SMC [Anaerovibrio lipolyticus]SHI71625.1 condensin subunit Smc [Anaerovibrio lipolyticus DSM 3074]
MQLKRLEAYGFKTFADKIEVDFDKGITAIVGPNGSGKSNISDAIKWVLGEQNIRNIRGTKAEDVIFNGSAARRAMGVAEVSLVFDNDGTMPVDFQEVTITRRLFRNGDSEFYINRARCRLKDITNLFADTGIGHDSMGIISQNKIDDVLNARPEERRLFFEEAAGITKYRNRKRESMRKLEDTESNLLRVQDIIGEIENQLEPLKLSAEKTEKYNALKEELKKFNLAGIYLNYLDLNKKKAKHTAAITAKKDQEIAARTALQLSENRKEQFDKAVLELEKEQEVISQKRNELHSQLEAAESDIKVLEERRRQGKASRQLLSQQLRELKAAVEEAQQDINDSTKSGEESQSTLEETTAKIQKCREQAKGLRESLQKKREERSHLEKQVQEGMQSYNAKNSQLLILERDLENDSQNRGDQLQQLEELQKEIALMERDQGELTLAAEETSKKKDSKAREIQLKENQLKEDNQTLVTLTREKNQLDGSIQKMASRLQIMENLQNSYEGFGKAVKAVLKSQTPWRQQVCGTVAELMEVPGKYVTAIETALGGALQNIVTKDTDTAKAAIEFLKRDRLGRVTFLPLSSITPRNNRENLPNGAKGVIGWAHEIVTTDDAYKKVMEFLLGRTLVVDTMDNAVSLNRQMGQRLRIVTLEGELLSPGGAMTGGSHQHRESSFLNRQDEIKQLRDKLAKDKKSFDDLQEKCSDLKRRIEVAASELDIFRNDLHALEMREQEHQLNVSSIEEKLTKANADYEVLEHTLENAQANFLSIQGKVAELRKETENLDANNKALNDELQEINDDYADMDQEAEDLSVFTNQLEHDKTVLEQSILRMKEKTLIRQRELSRNAEAISQNEQEIRRLDNELEESQNKIGGLITRTQHLQDDYAKAKGEYKEVHERRMEKLVESQKNEKETKAAQQRLNGIQDELHQLELNASHTEYDLEQLENEMLSEYGIVPERAAEMVPEMEPTALKRELKRLEREIGAIGVVNPNAPTEYKELLERHGFLSGNAEDLNNAKADLLKIIGEMDATMTKQFKEAFNSINLFFKDIFVRLFGGGEAKIILIDKDNVLESGVDIVVQIPDKKQQNLAVLSGGERALTVVALLFSFLRYRPAPFSLLDEVDAPLDEANIGRFGSFLEEYSSNTQFIVVTHRKGTMESADSMYGVTVEDAGVSKILSVKLKEAESMIEN